MSRLTLASSISLALICLLYGFERWVAEVWWPAWLLVETPQAIFLLGPLILLILAVLRLRRPSRDTWIVWLANLGSVVIVLAGLMGLRVHMAQRGVVGSPLRVMTYNVNKWTAGVPSVCAVVRGQNPDVVCMQEAGDYFYSRAPDASLQAQLPGYHIVRRGEIIVASRLPVLSVDAIPMPNDQPTRRALCVRVTTPNGKALTIVAVHLTPVGFNGSLAGLPAETRSSCAARTAQAETLVQRFAGSTDPVVICGDFNLPSQGRTYDLLSSRFADAFEARGNGFGYTLTATMPYERIDHVLLGGRGITPEAVSNPASRASDHLPLVAKLNVLE